MSLRLLPGIGDRTWPSFWNLSPNDLMRKASDAVIKHLENHNVQTATAKKLFMHPALQMPASLYDNSSRHLGSAFCGGYDYRRRWLHMSWVECEGDWYPLNPRIVSIYCGKFGKEVADFVVAFINQLRDKPEHLLLQADWPWYTDVPGYQLKRMFLIDESDRHCASYDYRYTLLNDKDK